MRPADRPAELVAVVVGLRLVPRREGVAVGERAVPEELVGRPAKRFAPDLVTTLTCPPPLRPKDAS